MANLTVTQTNLPTTIEDLAGFVLIGREKLVAVRAEIRAIDKLNLAESVRQQKRDEAQMLSEALLDAEVKIGELLKKIPKDPGGRPQKTHDTAVHSFEKPKHEVVQSLGFTPKQANRFETLANNPDIVEQVKAEARENEDIPTRSRVLQLVKEKTQPAKAVVTDMNENDLYKAANAVNTAILKASTITVSVPVLELWAQVYRNKSDAEFEMMIIDDALENLQNVKAFLTNGRLNPKLKVR